MRHRYCLLCMGGCLVWQSHPNRQTRQPSLQSEKYQCRISTVSSSDDGHILPETCREAEMNILRGSVHVVGFI